MKQPIEEVEEEELPKQNLFSRAMMLLRLEALVWLIVSVYLFLHFEGSWTFFWALFFVPDLTIFAFFLGKEEGTTLYNWAHTKILPLILICIGFFFDLQLMIQIGLVWFSHINFDRTVGFGLKYSDHFMHTHLGPLAFWKEEEEEGMD